MALVFARTRRPSSGLIGLRCSIWM